MPLNTEQEAAMTEILAGKSVFITGPGGVGKSYLIREIKSRLLEAGRSVGVTAMTGCAALQLECGAKTLHSWASIGLGRESVDALVAGIRRFNNQKAKARWKNTDVLIIDEVSMMTPELLEKLDSVGRIIRGKFATPMGGLQIVLVGDFCQLPPVSKDLSGNEVEPTLLFECSVWNEIIQKTICLKQIQRQSDPVFQRILNEARMGSLTAESVAVLESRKIKGKLSMMGPYRIVAVGAQKEKQVHGEDEKEADSRLRGSERTITIPLKFQTDGNPDEKSSQIMIADKEKRIVRIVFEPSNPSVRPMDKGDVVEDETGVETAD